MNITTKTKIFIESFIYKFIPMDVYLNVQRKVLRRVEPIIPQYIYQPLQNELSAALTRIETKKLSKKYENAKHLLLNIGAGPYGKSGWVNVDIYGASGINCVYDCRKSLPFPDNSVKGIFT